MKIQKHYRGFTLIELLIALSIGASVLFGVFTLVSKVQTKSIAKEAAESLNIMVADARAKFKSQGNFTGVTPKVLIDNRIPPSNMIQGNNIVSPWNTNIGVAPATLVNTDDAIAFTYTGIGIEDCSNFVQAAEGAFSRIEVNGTNVKDVPGGVTQLKVADLGTACTAGGANSTIVFIQGR